MTIEDKLLQKIQSPRSADAALYRQLQADLNLWCMHQKTGTRLPSERELTRASGLNRRTVRKAVAGLLADGVVERHGRTTRVSAPGAIQAAASADERRIGFVLVGLEHYDCQLGPRIPLMTCAAEASGFRLSMHAVTETEHDARLAAICELAADCHGLLLYGIVDRELAAAVDALPLPVVFLGSLQGDPLLPPIGCVIDSDPRAMGELATRTLLEDGHQRVGFLCGPLERGMWNERWLAGYHAAMACAQIAPHPEDVCVVCPADRSEVGTEAAAKFAAMPSRPSGYVIPNPLATARFLGKMTALGHPVDRRNIVIGGDRHEALTLQLGDICMLGQDIDELIRVSFRTLRFLVDGATLPCHGATVPFQYYGIHEEKPSCHL